MLNRSSKNQLGRCAWRFAGCGLLVRAHRGCAILRSQNPPNPQSLKHAMKPILAFRLNSLWFGLMIALCAGPGASAATIHVSGGGIALKNAITGAVGGDEIIVDDSLDYAPVDIGK